MSTTSPSAALSPAHRPTPFVVLFGAGASFGSEAAGVRRPPLGAHLFEELCAYAPSTWGSLSDPWPDDFGSDFEPAMRRLVDSETSCGPLQWDMGEYFFSQFRATADSAYVSILGSFASRINRLTFVTLNYETLLFQARDLVGIDEAEFSICLPHGSACLCCTGVQITPRGDFIGPVSTGGEVRYFRDLDDFRRERATNVLPPVMSYYEPKKFTVSGANFIEAERAWFSDAVGQAERIAIIGAAVHLSDEHIWSPLAKSPGKILYVTTPASDDAAVFMSWSSTEGRRDDEPLPKGFLEALNDLASFFS